MKIGIIGAGISGLTAGRILARAGHEVSVFEKSKGYGGRMSTRRMGGEAKYKMDHGAPFITGTSTEFKAFIRELEENHVIKKWTDSFSAYSEAKILPQAQGRTPQPCYVAPNGMNSIGKFMGRWLDFRFNEKVGGLTHIGGSRIKKSPWMINSSTINVFEADAVIIATPAIQAYGLVATAQDELELRRMITVLDEMAYTATYAYMMVYRDRKQPDWKALHCDHPVISWICNESSKRDSGGDVSLIAHTTDSFTQKMIDERDTEVVDDNVMQALGDMLGSWAGRPDWHESHLWRYHMPKNSLNVPFLESEDELAPIAVVGDYFQGRSMEAAYLSGLRLGKHWADKFS